MVLLWCWDAPRRVPPLFGGVCARATPCFSYICLRSACSTAINQPAKDLHPAPTMPPGTTKPTSGCRMGSWGRGGATPTAWKPPGPTVWRCWWVLRLLAFTHQT